MTPTENNHRLPLSSLDGPTTCQPKLGSDYGFENAAGWASRCGQPGPRSRSFLRPAARGVPNSTERPQLCCSPTASDDELSVRPRRPLSCKLDSNSPYRRGWALLPKGVFKARTRRQDGVLM
jgi:hypothetical protein